MQFFKKCPKYAIEAVHKQIHNFDRIYYSCSQKYQQKELVKYVSNTYF